MARQNRSKSATILTCLTAVLLTAAIPAGAEIFYVDVDSTAGTMDGESWCTAFDDLQSALAKARDSGLPHTIRIAQGTYNPHLTNRGVSFELVDGVDLEGGYAGIGGCVDPDTQDFALYETILSGDLPNNANNSYHVITCASGVTARLEGLTISDGYADGSGAGDKSGGGIQNGYGSSSPVAGGTLTLDDCKFENNHADLEGGGMSNVGNPATLSRCTFTDNDAMGGTLANGGAFYNHRGGADDDTNSIFTDCAFETNTAGDGGAVWSGGEITVSFTRCTFDQNSSNTSGGAVFLGSVSALTVNDSDFTSNTALSGGAMHIRGVQIRPSSVDDTTFTSNSATGTGGAGEGGALWIRATTSLSGCPFDSNTATIYGGAVHVTKESADATVLDYAGCIFDSNVAQVSGGAVYEGNNGLLITYLNSLFVANEAEGAAAGEGGGAIFNGGSGSVSYVNCTFVANRADGRDGGGIRVKDDTSPVITNCIFWDNCNGSTCATEDQSAQIHRVGSGNDNSVTYSTIEGCAQPGFCDESTNKAVQPTFVGSGAHPYQLQDIGANATLIDDGDGAENTHGTCPSVNDTSVDLADNTRFVRDDGLCVSNAAAIVDIGAYEVQ